MNKKIIGIIAGVVIVLVGVSLLVFLPSKKDQNVAEQAAGQEKKAEVKLEQRKVIETAVQSINDQQKKEIIAKLLDNMSYMIDIQKQNYDIDEIRERLQQAEEMTPERMEKIEKLIERMTSAETITQLYRDVFVQFSTNELQQLLDIQENPVMSKMRDLSSNSDINARLKEDKSYLEKLDLSSVPDEKRKLINEFTKASKTKELGIESAVSFQVGLMAEMFKGQGQNVPNNFNEMIEQQLREHVEKQMDQSLEKVMVAQLQQLSDGELEELGSLHRQKVQQQFLQQSIAMTKQVMGNFGKELASVLQ